MDGQLMDYSCDNFAKALASKTSVPGGGGAAALAGALSAALCSMVGNFTLGKKKYADYEEDVRRILGQAEILRVRLLELADEDAQAFEPLSKAYGIPKDAPGRGAVLESATRGACAAPLEMVRRCSEVAVLLEELLDKGSTMLVSDVGCGALLCGAALESAALNVYINTKSLRDRETAARMEEEVGTLVEENTARTRRIAAEVARRVRE